MGLKRVSRRGAVLLVVLLVASACGQASPSASPTASGTAAYRLATPGKLTIGYTPIAGISDIVDGKPTGLGLLMSTEIAKRLGLEPVYASYDFAAVFPALQSHRIDFIGEQIAGTQPRAQVLYINTPATLWGPETLIVRPGTTIASWEDAAARKLTLASVKGYFQITAWEALGITVHAFDNNDACMTDVLNKGADACGIGSFDLVYRKATKPDDPISGLEQVVVVGPQIVTEGSIFATARDNAALARDIDQILIDMWRDGSVETAYKGVFGTADYGAFLQAPPGSNYYILGPWEEGVRPPAKETFAKVDTIASGTLTVGVLADGPLLTLTGETLSGPEAKILEYAANNLGLKLKGVRVTDEAAAVRGGQVDVVAGQLATTPDRTKQYWMSQPIGFNPDYIYVKPEAGGSFPAFASWEDVTKAGGKLSVVNGSPRIADLQAAGANILMFDTPAAALKAVVDGQALGFVGSSLEYAVAASADPSISQAGIGYVRNGNIYSHGDAFAWGVKAGNGKLLDALDQSNTLAWQKKVIGDAYGQAWPGADVNAVAAPGPALVGTGFGTTKDFIMRSMWVSGAWLQRPGYVQ